MRIRKRYAAGTLDRLPFVAAAPSLRLLDQLHPVPSGIWYKTQLAEFLIAKANAKDPKAVSPTEGPFASGCAKPKTAKPEKS